MFSTLIIGGIAGAVYSLIASGLVLTYSTTGIFNLGYGAIAFTSGVVFYELNTGLHWNRFLVAILIVFVLCPLLGLILDWAIFRPLAKTSEAAKVVGTVGVLVGLPALVQFIIETGRSTLHWGIPSSQNITLTPGVLFTFVHTWHWGSVTVDSNQLLVVGTAIVCAVGLWALSRTATGLRMRGVVDSPNLAALRGVSQITTLRLATVLGTVLAGIAGVVGAPVFNSLDAGTWTVAVFIAATAVVIGRFRSIPMSFAGGIVIGMLMGLTFRYVHLAKISGLNNAVPFVLLLAGLLALGRSKTRAGGTASLEVAPRDWRADLPQWRRRAIPVTASALLIVWIAGVADPLWASVLLRGAAFAIIMLSFTLVTGLGGMISLAQSSFALTAALTAGLLTDRYHVPFGLSVVVAVVVAMALGAVVALPAMRLGGTALTLATLALAFLCSSILFEWHTFTNGDSGWTFKRPFASTLDFSHDRIFALALLALSFVAIWAIVNLSRASTGRALATVRATELAAGSIGISAVTAKLRVFVLSAGLAGIGGVLLGTVLGGVTGSTIGTLDGLTWLTVVVLLGVRRPAAAVTAGFVYIAFPALLSGGFHHVLGISWSGSQSSQIPAILFGLGAAGLARQPEGAFANFSEMRFRRRERRRAEASPAVLAVPPGPSAALAGSVGASGAAAASNGGARRLLHVARVSAGYDSVKVLDEVCLELPAGSMTALLGANGAGKSTLCNTLGGSLAPMAGAIYWDGADITDRPPYARAGSGLVLVPETRGIFPRLTVDENLKMTLKEPDDRRRVYEKFPQLGTRRRFLAEMLSGGEQQILALGPLLVQPPRLLVIDEPSLGLAPLLVGHVTDLLLELKALGTTVLVAEERPGRLLQLADQVILLSLGRVVWTGPATEVTDADIRAAYHLDHQLARR
jgi:ABC-type branched-subunit amino acid transport system ATPase component/branched-subunit amino acid ABC-type transport system permease component